MSAWKRFVAWRNRCRTCENDGIDGSLLAGFPELTRVEDLRSGHLYRCGKCGGSWFLDAEKRWARRVDDGELALLRRWDKGSFALPDTTLGVLSRIGGVLNHSGELIVIPCSARTTTGQQHDKAIVVVSKLPPGGEDTKFHAADEMASVAPSAFALPLEIRRASAEKMEESMGFAPVGVVDGRGREYTLGCESVFLDKDGAKGESMRLSARTSGWRNVVWPEPVEAVYFADWFQGCEERLVPRDTR